MTTVWPLNDMHVHATRYRLGDPQPEMTVSNIVHRLERRGCSVAGVIEHLDMSPKHPLWCLEALVQEFQSISSTVSLFVGAELEYKGKDITFPEAEAVKQRLGLDFYLAAAHGVGHGVTSTVSFIEDHHRRLMAIVQECAHVDVVAHPWAEGHAFAKRGQIPKWHFEMIPDRYLHEFAEAAAFYDKAIEINRKALVDAAEPAFQHYLHLLCVADVQVTTGSDAHALRGVGAVEPLNELLRDAGFGPASLWRPTRC